MKLPKPSQKVIFAAGLLLATNIITGLVSTWAAHSRDFSEMNLNCLLNWGGINADFENIRSRQLPRMGAADKPLDETRLYRIHEDNARFLVHYPKFCHRQGLDKSRAITLFCWAVAAESYRSNERDVQIDPAVWQAFLADGPKDLPVYWQLRASLSSAGADQGIVKGEQTGHLASWHKSAPYKMGPLSTPYQPLPDEATPL